jgi:hypothetical protein
MIVFVRTVRSFSNLFPKGRCLPRVSGSEFTFGGDAKALTGSPSQTTSYLSAVSLILQSVPAANAANGKVNINTVMKVFMANPLTKEQLCIQHLESNEKTSLSFHKFFEL